MIIQCHLKLPHGGKLTNFCIQIKNNYAMENTTSSELLSYIQEQPTSVINIIKHLLPKSVGDNCIGGDANWVGRLTGGCHRFKPDTKHISLAGNQLQKLSV